MLVVDDNDRWVSLRVGVDSNAAALYAFCAAMNPMIEFPDAFRVYEVPVPETLSDSEGVSDTFSRSLFIG